MKGRRVYPDSEGHLVLKEGDYGKDPRDGNWYARPPGKKNHMGNLAKHEIEEHEDGTITVKPSILVSYEYADKKSGAGMDIWSVVSGGKYEGFEFETRARGFISSQWCWGSNRGYDSKNRYGIPSETQEIHGISGLS